jgi:hypothetical protein
LGEVQPELTMESIANAENLLLAVYASANKVNALPKSPVREICMQGSAGVVLQ